MYREMVIYQSGSEACDHFADWQLKIKKEPLLNNRQISNRFACLIRLVDIRILNDSDILPPAGINDGTAACGLDLDEAEGLEVLNVLKEESGAQVDVPRLLTHLLLQQVEWATALNLHVTVNAVWALTAHTCTRIVARSLHEKTISNITSISFIQSGRFVPF